MGDLPYSDCKVLGPYLRPDGRMHVVITHKDGSKTTVSYPKYITEIRLGRYLADGEEIDHDDQNFKNNSPENLVVRKHGEHQSLDVKRLKEQVFMCPVCYVVLC